MILLIDRFFLRKLGLIVRSFPRDLAYRTRRNILDDRGTTGSNVLNRRRQNTFCLRVKFVCEFITRKLQNRRLRSYKSAASKTFLTIRKQVCSHLWSLLSTIARNRCRDGGRQHRYFLRRISTVITV